MLKDFVISTPTVRCSADASRFRSDDFVGTSIDNARKSCVDTLGGTCGIKVDETSHKGPDKVDTELIVGCTKAKVQECGDRILALLAKIQKEFPYVEE